eukprot:126894_1
MLNTQKYQSNHDTCTCVTILEFIMCTVWITNAICYKHRDDTCMALFVFITCMFGIIGRNIKNSTCLIVSEIFHIILLVVQMIFVIGAIYAIYAKKAPPNGPPPNAALILMLICMSGCGYVASHNHNFRKSLNESKSENDVIAKTIHS